MSIDEMAFFRKLFRRREEVSVEPVRLSCQHSSGTSSSAHARQQLLVFQNLHMERQGLEQDCGSWGRDNVQPKRDARTGCLFNVGLHRQLLRMMQYESGKLT